LGGMRKVGIGYPLHGLVSIAGHTEQLITLTHPAWPVQTALESACDGVHHGRYSR